MKFINKLTVAIITTVLIIASSPMLEASAATYNQNPSHDYETRLLSLPSKPVIVPFWVGTHIYMDSTVKYPGKIIIRESLKGVFNDGRIMPFSFSWRTDRIKYYKNGSYLSTHIPSLRSDIIGDSSDVISAHHANPYSNLSSSATYKGVGNAVFFSTETVPAAFSVDTTESVVN